MESKFKVWIIEDDRDICEIYKDILIDRKIETVFFERIEGFESALLGGTPKPDLLVADLNLPDGNFLDFLSAGEASEKIDFPFIIISSIDDLGSLKSSFEEGALDYLVKPFKKNELLVKIDRALSNASSAKGFIYDPYTQTLSKDGQVMAYLSLKEMKLFSLLHEAKGKPIERENLYLQLWPEKDVVAKTLDVHIFNMRRKLRKSGLKIKAYKAPSSFALLQD